MDCIKTKYPSFIDTVTMQSKHAAITQKSDIIVLNILRKALAIANYCIAQYFDGEKL